MSNLKNSIEIFDFLDLYVKTTFYIAIPVQHRSSKI